MTADELLNLGARVLLRACAPPTVHALLRRVGAVLPQRNTHEDVRKAAEQLTRGSCLSRALAIAARSPSADVVIGVRPEGGTGLYAHAWVEVDGKPLHPSDPGGSEIARLRGRPRRSKEAGWSPSPPA
jgi:hypothetical protein